MKSFLIILCALFAFTLTHAGDAAAKGRGGASYRSAKSGKFTTGGYAKSHPSTTVRERR